MKRYIKCDSGMLNFTDLFDSIDAIIIVNDINVDYSRIGVTASAILCGEDYDSYSKRELLRLSDDELEEIDTVGALNKLYEMHNAGYHYSLTTDQMKIMKSGWEKFTDYVVTVSDIRNVLKMIRDCSYLDTPSRRTGDPYKNFAETHNLDMTNTDYLNILKDVKATECVTKFNGVKRNSGTELFVFIHPGNNYKLILPQKTEAQQIITDDIKIYVKISVNPMTKAVLAYVSFHDVDSDDIELSLVPSYYDVSDELYDFAESVVNETNDWFEGNSENGKIVNKFRYDSVHYKNGELEISFVDSFDEDFVIQLEVEIPISDIDKPKYINEFVEKLISEWNDRDTFYRNNYPQNE